MTCVFTYKGKEYVGEEAFKAALKAAPFDEIKGFLRPSLEAAKAELDIALREQAEAHQALSKYVAADAALDALMPLPHPRYRFAQTVLNFIDTERNSQEGGFAAPTKDRQELRTRAARLAALDLKANEAEQKVRNAEEATGIPNAPFKNNGWAALVLKRMIRWGAENGFDSVAWTPGEVQAERYDLSKTVDRLQYSESAAGDKLLTAGGREFVISEKGDAKSLDELVGKEMAARIMAQPAKDIDGDSVREVSGENMKVGGQGMLAFYDHILVNEANKLGKKYGAKVGTAKLSAPETKIAFADRGKSFDERQPTWHSLPLTPELKAAAMAGQPLFQGGKGRRGEYMPSQSGPGLTTLFRTANLSTLLHEGAHEYLDILWRLSKQDNPNPFVVSQLAAILEWKGHSPSWDNMFDDNGQITSEGRELQEAFAESYELYLREGKAPTSALRSVFSAIKAWMLSIYKSLAGGGFVQRNSSGKWVPALSRARLDPEITAVFDRMLATEEAIGYAHGQLAMNAEKMAEAMADKLGKDWTPERREKFLDRTRTRLAAAKEKAESELMAQLMEEYTRNRQSAWRAEERDVRAEITREVMERPEQRAYDWLAGKGWADPGKASNPGAMGQQDPILDFARYYDHDANDDSLRALVFRLADDGQPPTVGVLKLPDGRVIGFQYAFNGNGWTHQEAIDILRLDATGVVGGTFWPSSSLKTLTWNRGGYASHDRAGPALGQFMGEGSPTAPRQKLQSAMEMLAVGFSTNEVWQATGWARSLDGEWMWEIPGAPTFITKPFDPDAHKGQPGKYHLDDVIAWPELFEALPALRDVLVEHQLGNDAGGTAYADAADLERNGVRMVVPFIEVVGNNEAQVMSILRHEIQHVITRTLGWRTMGGADYTDPGDYRDTPEFQREFKRYASFITAKRPGPLTDAETRFIEKKVAKNLYLRQRDEVRARDVERRAKWPEDMRRHFAPNTRNPSEVDEVDLDHTWATLEDLKHDDFTRYDAFVPDGEPDGSAGGDRADSGDGSAAGAGGEGARAGAGASQRQIGKSAGAAGAGSTLDVDGVTRPTTNEFGRPIAATEEAIRNFWRWFGDSKVVNAQGEPLVLYHGTTADFEHFDRERANVESDMGAGFYFTSEREDVAANYAGFGPDLTNKIQNEAERIASETGRDYDDADVKAEAREKFVRHEGATLPVYLALKNPVILAPDAPDETRFTFGFEYEEDGNPDSDIVGEKGTLIDFVMALRNVATRYDDGDVDGLIEEITTHAMDDDGIGAGDIYEKASQNERFGYFTDDSGVLVSKEILRLAFEAVGFDGVIDRAVDAKFGSGRAFGGGKMMEGMNPDTVHYIAFEPTQIKSAIGNSGAFNPLARAIGRSLGQSDSPQGKPPLERRLDAMGFYSAVQVAADAIPANIWNMGWQAVRNSLAKGRDGVTPKRAEIEYMGLDAMFGDSKLKGAELREAVLADIAASRLELVERYARFDPENPPQRKVTREEWLMDGKLLTRIIDLGGRIQLSGSSSRDDFQEYAIRVPFKVDHPVRWWRKAGGSEWFVSVGYGVGENLREGKPGYTRQEEAAEAALRTFMDRNIEQLKRRVRASDIQPEPLEHDEAGIRKGPGETRLPGKEPVFEWRALLPKGEPGAEFKSHWTRYPTSDEGVLVSVRGEERIDDKGQRTLFGGEVQSDMGSFLRAFREKKDGEARWIKEAEYAGQNLANLEGVPLAGDTTSWTQVAVRAMVYRAARDGFGSVAFPNAETSTLIQGNDSAAMHYETNVLGALQKIAKQLGGTVRAGGVWAEGVADVRDEYGTLSEEIIASAEESFQQGEYEQVFEFWNNSFAVEFTGALDNQRRQEVLQQYRAQINTLPNAQRSIVARGLRVVELEMKKFGHTAEAYVLDITPEMRAKIVREGFPLWQGDDGAPPPSVPPAGLPPMRLDLQAIEDEYGPEALASLPPEVRAHSTSASDADSYLSIAVGVRIALNAKAPKSLVKFLSTNRPVGKGKDRIAFKGIRDAGGEIMSMLGAKGTAPGLIADPAKDGKAVRSMSVHQAALAAYEAKYTSEVLDDAAFLDLIGQDVRKGDVYSAQDQARVDEIAAAKEWARWFDMNGVDIEQQDSAAIKAQIEAALSGDAEGAIGPDAAAPFFGMATGRELLDALRQGPQREKLIRELTQQRMTERHGDVFNDGTIMEAARVFAMNEVMQRQGEIELDALARAAGQQVASSFAKVEAREALRGKQVREILNYNQWFQLEQRYGRMAFEAAGKGKMDEALRYKRFQLLNLHMYREGKAMAEEIEKERKRLLTYDTTPRRVRLMEAGEDYAAQMRSILEGYEFKKTTTKKTIAERLSLREWFAAKQAEMDPLRDDKGLTDEERMAAQQEAIDRSAALQALQEDAELRNYKALTLDEFMAVVDQADLVWRMARNQGNLLLEQERRSLRLAAEDGAQSVRDNQKKQRKPEPYASLAPKNVNKRGRKEYFLELRTLQSLIRQVFDGGKDGGWGATFILRVLNKAFGERTERMQQAQSDIAKLYKDAYGDKLGRLRTDRVMVPGFSQPLALMERLAVALNAGTEINRKRVMDGEGWDSGAFNRVLATLDERDWKFVRAVWAYVDGYFAEANEVHKAIHGAPMSKQPGIPVVTRFGVIEGSYWPIVFDPYRSSKTAQRGLEAEAKGAAGRVGTRQRAGFTKERVNGKVTLPILLDVSAVLTKHMADVIGTITTQKAMLDVGRLIMRPEIEVAVVERHGREVYVNLIDTLRETRNGSQKAAKGAERALTRLRNGATIVGLGLNIGTAIKQQLGHANSLVRLGGVNLGALGGARWLMVGVYRYGFGVEDQVSALKSIEQKSTYMRHRRKTQSREIADVRNRVDAGDIKGGARNFIDAASMFLITQSQYLGVDAPLWLGAYEKALHYGADEEAAIASADQTVIDAQGSGEIYQLAGLQRGSPLLKLFTNFLTGSITTWNMAAARTAMTNFKNPAQAAAWALDMGVLMTVPAVMMVLIDSALKGGGDDDDEDPFLEKLMKEQAGFILSQLGLFGQVGGAIEGFGYKGPQGTRAFADLNAAVQAGVKDAERIAKGEAPTGALIRPFGLALGAWYHLPTAALDRAIRGGAAIASGEITEPVPMAQALISGPPPE